MKLASIERITQIKPIVGADKIEVATVLGYQTVIKRGEFAVGDYCVWHNPDTITADKPCYEFLRRQDFRLKLVKLRGQISQGLALPLSCFPELVMIDIIEGVEVSELIGIKKYEKPIPAQLAGVIRGSFPTWLRKTDEDNLRSNIKALEELQGKPCVITKKIDGCSGTFAFKDGEFHVLSRNIDLKEDNTNTYWRIAEQFNLYRKLGSLAYDIALQGEVYGLGIQGNKLGLPDVRFAAFNLFDVNNYKYYNHDQLQMICKDLDIPTVPEIWRGKFEFTLEEILKFANEQTYENGSPCEGIVIRPIEECDSRALKGRLSVKVISEVFAEKYGE